MAEAGLLQGTFDGKELYVPAFADGKNVTLKVEKGEVPDNYVTQDELAEHTENADVHILPSERSDLQRLVALFPEVDPDTPSTPEPTIPAGALSHSRITSYFATNAQPGLTVAPLNVYVTRVPLARWDADNSKWNNNESTVNEEVFGAAKKFMDNAGLEHTCSTDTVEGKDDYCGLWAFHWQHGNYITDEYGTKHLTAIKGQLIDGHPFDPEKPTCAFGPEFWFFCKEEKYQDPETGNWLTSDGTESGEALFQLWGISSRSWNNLDESRQNELLAHGITEADFSIWPSCQQYDGENGIMVNRPYWIHSAYCGGYELSENGENGLVSKIGKPVYNNLSHNTFTALYGSRGGFGGSASVQGFGILFDIIKNATKNSQLIHYGMASNVNSAVKATQSTAIADYIFPISSQGNFRVGCTVWLWQTNGSSSGGTTYVKSIAVQIGRIDAIETRTVNLLDGTTVNSLCLVIDPTTVEPFVVRTGATNDEAIAATKELTDAGQYACCFATQGMALAGETEKVIGKHDGSRTSLTDGKHPYRVQGTEYMPGVWICAADTVAIKGTGSTAVTIDGMTTTPTSSEYVYLQNGPTIATKTSGSLQNYIDAGYKPIGVGPTTGGFVVNVQMSKTGVVYPTGMGGSCASDSTGHADNMWAGASPAEFLVGGSLNHGSSVGSCAFALDSALGLALWNFGGRD